MKRFLLALPFLASCGLYVPVDQQYDSAFPRKYPYRFFYPPTPSVNASLYGVPPFAVDTNALPPTVAAYHDARRPSREAEWPKDTVEICGPTGCARTEVQLLNLDSRSTENAVFREVGIHGLRWSAGRLHVLKHFYPDGLDSLYEVNLATGVLDFAKPDSALPPVLSTQVKYYGWDPISGEDSTQDSRGNFYRSNRIQVGGSSGSPFSRLVKVAVDGSASWERTVPMSISAMAWLDGNLYLAGSSGYWTMETSDYSACIAKVGPDSTLHWVKTYHAASVDKSEGITSLRVDGKGRLVAIGESGAGGRSYLYCLRVDTTGTVSFERIHEDKDKVYSIFAARILQIKDGLLRFVGNARDNRSNTVQHAVYGEIELP